MEDDEKLDAEMLHEGKYILKTDERVKAHIFVASLAFFLKRTLEYQLSSKLPKLTASDAFNCKPAPNNK